MGGGRKRRRLSPEESALWSRIAETAKPLKKRDARAEHSEAEPPRPVPVHAPKPRVRAKPPQSGVALKPGGGASWPGVSVDLAPRGVSPTPRGPVGGLDRRTAERVRKGTRTPDDRIDLHGMTAERAHAALNRFVLQGAASGARLLLVITGKGGDKAIRAPGESRGDHHGEDAAFMPRREGVLRREVPRWLAEPPLAHHVVAVFQAHARHGGEGALYVYLKKVR